MKTCQNSSTRKVVLEYTMKMRPHFADGSYMHRKSPDAEVMDVKGNPIIKAKPKLSLYDVEYKLDGMVVVPMVRNSLKL